jgi:antitoxin component of RelBE/YafQ-DinJ toxin-antitoxin module
MCCTFGGKRAILNKTATVRARLEPGQKEKAEAVHRNLGLSTTHTM